MTRSELIQEYNQATTRTARAIAGMLLDGATKPSALTAARKLAAEHPNGFYSRVITWLETMTDDDERISQDEVPPL